jgi:hypothetical protein
MSTTGQAATGDFFNRLLLSRASATGLVRAGGNGL